MGLQWFPRTVSVCVGGGNRSFCSRVWKYYLYTSTVHVVSIQDVVAQIPGIAKDGFTPGYSRSDWETF